MWLLFSTTSSHTLIAVSLHFDSCHLDPKYMNSVFSKFILRWFCDIHSLISFKQLSKEPKAFLSYCFALGVNPLLREWSSAKPFSRIGLLHLTGSQSGPTLSILLAWWITYWGVLEYAMSGVGPHNSPGWLRSWGISLMTFDPQHSPKTVLGSGRCQTRRGHCW